MSPQKLRCTYFVDSVQGGRQYMEDFLLSTETEHSVLCGKSVYNHRLVTDCETTIFGVFDGHGGPEAAKYAQCNILSEIIKQPGYRSVDVPLVIKALDTAFTSTSLKMWTVMDTWSKTASGRPSTAGTTASIVMINDNKMYIAHVGDSTVVLGVSEQPSAFSDSCVAKVLTLDHKPSLPEEKQRIEQSGGSVMEKAGVSRVVWRRQKLHNQQRILRSTSYDNIPFLAVSRALGDLWSYNMQTGDYSVSPKPDVSVHEIDVKQHKFLILATDGLWNVVRPSEATAVVSRYIAKTEKKNMAISDDNSLMNMRSPASLLINIALQRWSHHRVAADNISVIVVLFEGDICEATSSSPSSSDSGVDCSGSRSTPIHRYASKRRLLGDYSCPSKRRLLQLSELANKRRKSCSQFRIPTTSVQWRNFWSRRGSIGEIMTNSVLHSIDSNQLAAKVTPVVLSKTSQLDKKLNSVSESVPKLTYEEVTNA